jgi:putative salt-induced outer membrane protein YdiY
MRTIPIVILFSLLAQPLQAQKQQGWRASLALGLNATDGNARQLTANATLTVDYRKAAIEFSYLAEGNYGEAETTADDGTTATKTTIRNARSTSNLKYRWTGAYLYIDTATMKDDIAGIEYRWAMGPGIGYFLLDGEATRLTLETGITYIRESLAADDGTETKDDIPALRIAHLLEHAFSPTAKFWESVEFLPDLEDTDAYLVNVEVGVEAALTQLGALRTVLQNKYDSVPPTGRESNDLSIVASLVFKL